MQRTHHIHKGCSLSLKCSYLATSVLSDDLANRMHLILCPWQRMQLGLLWLWIAHNEGIRNSDREGLCSSSTSGTDTSTGCIAHLHNVQQGFRSPCRSG